MEQLDNAKQKLINELATLKMTLDEKDHEIQRYQKKNKLKRGFFYF
jgi:hypothetical protein